MCSKKLFPWWFKPEPLPEPDPAKPRRVALLFGINDYRGSGNDLKGCINDINDTEKMLNEKFPGFIIHKFIDEEATIGRFKSEVESEISLLQPGSVIVTKFDSCYSETATREPARSRFMYPEISPRSRFMYPGIPPRQFTRQRVGMNDTEDMRWLSFSGCQDNQTSADAFINGKYNGAFTFYDLHSIQPGITYRHEFEFLRGYLPSASFNQEPSLEGPESLKDKIIFEDPTLLICYSGHGSYTYDIDGDEGDGQDEVICLYNGNLLDDDINDLLLKIST